jgi:hypothetical protein
LTAGPASSVNVTFDDLVCLGTETTIPPEYKGVQWGEPWRCLDGANMPVNEYGCSGYMALSAQTSSGPNVAFSAFGGPVNISFPSGGPLRGLLRFKAMAAWDDNLELGLTAVQSGTILGSVQFPLSMTVALTIEVANYAVFENATDIVFNPRTPQESSCLCDEKCVGNHFVIDDMEFKI